MSRKPEFSEDDRSRLEGREVNRILAMQSERQAVVLGESGDGRVGAEPEDASIGDHDEWQLTERAGHPFRLQVAPLGGKQLVCVFPAPLSRPQQPK